MGASLLRIVHQVTITSMVLAVSNEEALDSSFIKLCGILLLDLDSPSLTPGPQVTRILR